MRFYENIGKTIYKFDNDPFILLTPIKLEIDWNPKKIRDVIELVIENVSIDISRIYLTTILKQYYLEDYIVTRSTCGRRCKLNPQPRTPILLFDKVYLNEKYLEKLGNPFPNFIDLRVSNEEDFGITNKK